jgi:hypothetical protein
MAGLTYKCQYCPKRYAIMRTYHAHLENKHKGELTARRMGYIKGRLKVFQNEVLLLVADFEKELNRLSEEFKK